MSTTIAPRIPTPPTASNAARVGTVETYAPAYDSWGGSWGTSWLKTWWVTVAAAAGYTKRVGATATASNVNRVTGV
jgi:hypothetical protein